MGGRYPPGTLPIPSQLACPLAPGPGQDEGGGTLRGVTSRDVAFDLLLSGILDIRAMSESIDGEDNLLSINLLAHLIHNWPDALRGAADEKDFDAALRRMWHERDRRSDPWMAERLASFGVDPRQLEDAGNE